MKHTLIRLVLLGSIATAVPAFAETAAPDAASAPAPAYVLNNRSAFTPVTDDCRAPFWPIGWVKRKPVAIAATAPAPVPVAPKVTLDPGAFKVTSILLGDPALAIINGRTYSEGEFIRMPRGGGTVAMLTGSPTARVRVYRINDGRVALQCEDQIVSVALQRPELAQRRGDEQLLLEDRP